MEGALCGARSLLMLLISYIDPGLTPFGEPGMRRG